MDQSTYTFALTSPDRTFLERMGHFDGCDNCIVNYSMPMRVLDLPTGGFLAAYECAVCGHRWSTEYGSDA